MLKIGKINYLNVYPLYQNLKGFNLISGEPSYLNRLIRVGEIDISPSSTFEYFQFPEKYFVVDNLSISSNKKVLSVLLLTYKPIEDIYHDKIFLSSSSSTSNVLLQIIFYEFLNRGELKFESQKENLFEAGKNQLIIGDEALKIYFNKPSGCFIYDIAQIWENYTGLPFVFALWLVNRVSFEKRMKDINDFINIIVQNKLSYTIPSSYKDFTVSEIDEYFKYIDYNFSSKHKASLELFLKLSVKYKFIKNFFDTTNISNFLGS